MSRVERWLKELTLEEKASLCSGRDFWHTKAVERLGIPSWMMTDGPHGLRKQPENAEMSLLGSVPATCFPSGVGLASSWNRGLIEEVGRALGQEAQANQVGVVLGPAVNIKRSPLCGRNFEYLSEDPYLAGEMARHHIRGVQSQGVGASIKHFAANNQEKFRMTIDTIVDERTLREIYFPAFEAAVKDAQPWTVMSSYNRINGAFASENAWLLRQVLKKEWGHEGVVVTDWGANNDRVAGLKAGQELEMPGNGGFTDADIVKAVREGHLSMADLDASVRRVLALTDKVLNGRKEGVAYDADRHHELARRAAREGMVLLKNEGGLLPLKPARIAFVGRFAQKARYQGGGSSHITPTRVDEALAEARALGHEVKYAAGYAGDMPDESLLAEARETAKAADVAVVFIGLTDAFESEGFDRSHLGIPASHTALLDAVLAVQPRTVVVLSNGSPIEMPWAPSVPAILEGYLGGQGGGRAVVDLLWGHANPSGKLAESFPVRLEDNSAFLNFPGDRKRVEYREGLFVGYRHHDAVRTPALFPFGHGLSYTAFEYGPLTVKRPEFGARDVVEASIKLTNTGPMAGAEVVQLYVGDREASVVRPVRELKAFEKVFLQPGESREVEFRLEQRAFAYWSVDEGAWTVEPGEFELSVGSSSRDLRSTAVVTATHSRPAREFDENTRLGDLEGHPVAGAFVGTVLKNMTAAFGQYEPGSAEERMMRTVVGELPLRNLVRFSKGQLPPWVLHSLLGLANGFEKLKGFFR